MNGSGDDQKKLLTLHGWSVLAHPMFLDQMTRLALAAAEEIRDPKRTTPGPNTKLLAHLKDLAFDAIPRDPANKAYRQGKTLGPLRKHWFRGKTGNGRYRLFFRFHSPSRVIVLGLIAFSVNGERSTVNG